MKFYYKTKDGRTASTDSVDAVPSNLDKLIVRRYDGRGLRLNNIATLNHLILDCNRCRIGSIIFNTYNLSVYKPNIHWFYINDVGVSNDLRSTFNTLIRLKLEHVTYTRSMLKNTLCASIIPELDFTGMVWCYDIFQNTNIDNIPHNIKIPTAMGYVDFYKGSKIPNNKLLTIDKLIAIRKKGKVS